MKAAPVVAPAPASTSSSANARPPQRRVRTFATESLPIGSADSADETAPGLGFDFAAVPIAPPPMVSAAPPAIQAKTIVGAEDDPLEREADDAAFEVMKQWEAPREPPEEPGSGHSTSRSILSAQATPDRSYATPGLADDGEYLEDDAVLSMGGLPLPSSVRSFFEQRYGHEFSAVRVHSGAEAERHNAALQSHAFTYGSHVWLGAGQPVAPSFVLAHELAHVIQQTQPRRTAGPSLAGAPSSIQRLPYWEPLHETGTHAHQRVIPDMANASGVFGEAPMPERGTGAGGLGTRGKADFYRASGPGGNNTVAVRFEGHDQPRKLGGGGLIVPTGVTYDHDAQGAPLGPRLANGAITRVDRAPTQIELGELKPAFGADPEPQLSRYKDALRQAAQHTNGYANREPAGASWNLLPVGSLAQSDLTIPAAYTPGDTSQPSQPLVLKEFNLERRQVRTFLQTQGLAITGRLRVKFEGTAGSWLYAWVPDSFPTGLRLPASVERLGPQIIVHLRDPLFQFPLTRRTPGTQPKLRASARRAGRFPAPRALARDRAHMVRRNGRRQEDPFRQRYTQWQADLRRYSQEFSRIPRTDRQSAEAATDLVQGHQNLLRHGWTTTPLSSGEQHTKDTFSAAQLWTGLSARTIGFFRYHFGFLFEKIANAYEWLRTRIQQALRTKQGSATGDGITRAVIQMAFRLIKLAGRILIDRTFDLLVDSLVQGVNDKITEWSGIDTQQTIDDLAGRMEQIKDQLAAAALQQIEQLLGQGIVNNVITVLEQLNQFQSMLADISRLVSIARWGLRLIECLSPPGWGCLWILAQAAGEALLAQVVESCWFQRKIAPHITALPWLGRIPRMLASEVVDFVNGLLPGWLSGMFHPITVDTNLDANQVPCDEPAHGGGGGRSMPDDAMADAMINLAERVGEDRLRAFARMSQRMGIPAGRPITPEDLRQIGDQILASGVTAAEMEHFAEQRAPTATGGLLTLATYLLAVKNSAASGPVDHTQQWGVTATERERQQRAAQASTGTPGPRDTAADRPPTPPSAEGSQLGQRPAPPPSPDEDAADYTTVVTAGPSVVDAATRPYGGRATGERVPGAAVVVLNASPAHQVGQHVLLWVTGTLRGEERITVYNVTATVVARQDLQTRWRMTYRIVDGVSLSPEIPNAVLPAGFELQPMTATH